MFQRKKCRSFKVNRLKYRATKGKHLRKTRFSATLIAGKIAAGQLLKHLKGTKLKPSGLFII